MLHSLLLKESEISLLTDLYEITMAAAYHASGTNDTAVFELYFRRLPRNRSYLLAAGLEQALHYLTNLHITQEDLDYLRSLETFAKVDSSFFDFLRELRFTGDIWAIAEGTPVFPLEPVLQVRAPLIEAQLLETYLLAVLNMQTMVATKAARIVHAAKGRGVVDFGTRRAHGPQAGLYAARASYIGGCFGSSNVLAGKHLGIPVFGTAAHSFTMAYPTELDAFRAYHRVFPDQTVLLIDTYDTLKAAKDIYKVSPKVQGVRIDSGDLLDLSKKVRKILDQSGMKDVRIFLSGDLNEYSIEELLQGGSAVDYFGVGTELVTSYDDPALSGVYKLVETVIEGKSRPVMKVSPGKISYPFRKQIYRFEKDGFLEKDLICIASEPAPPGGRPLLEAYVEKGNIVRDLLPIGRMRDYATANLRRLPPEYHNLRNPAESRVQLSSALLQATEELEKQL